MTSKNYPQFLHSHPNISIFLKTQNNIDQAPTMCENIPARIVILGRWWHLDGISVLHPTSGPLSVRCQSNFQKMSFNVPFEPRHEISNNVVSHWSM